MPVGWLRHTSFLEACSFQEAGQRGEGLETLREALAQRLAGDKFSLARYRLLAEPLDPPDWIREMIQMVRGAAE